jgi:hypothetical protein
MKKIMILLILTIFAVVALVFAAENSSQGLRPSQKIMRARAAGLGLMNRLLTGKRWKMIQKSADDLRIETSKTGKNLADPTAKQLTLDIAALAQDVSNAAMSKDGKTIKTKLMEIKGKCQECHIKFRK